MQALSINPIWYGVNRVAEKMIQLEKEKLAALVAEYLWRSLTRYRRRQQAPSAGALSSAAT